MEILTVDSTQRSPLAQTDLAQTETRPFLAPLIEVVCGVPVVTKYILLIIGTPRCHTGRLSGSVDA